MSDFKVPLTNILTISPHPKADRLEFATVYGFQVIVKKDQYKVGDAVVYIPIDSILPEWLENKLFPADSKIKLNSHRVRQIRIRGMASQGMLVDTQDVASKVNFKKAHAEDDLAETLGITKYEPPVPGPSSTQGKDKQRNKRYEHPLFHKYNGLDSIKWFPTMFKDGQLVVITEKLHGTHARASVLPFRANTFWRKVQRLFGLAPQWEQCYGSNNVQKAVGRDNKHFYSEDVWGNAFKALGVFPKLKVGESVFGEIIGPGIQANYDYGLTEHRFVLFDVKVLDPITEKQTWLSPAEVEEFARVRGFEHVPILYRGPYDKDVAYRLTTGPSMYCGDQKVREGIVIKAAENYSIEGNKQALKWVSEDYLDDKSNTDNH